MSKVEVVQTVVCWVGRDNCKCGNMSALVPEAGANVHAYQDMFSSGFSAGLSEAGWIVHARQLAGVGPCRVAEGACASVSTRLLER